MLSTKRSHGKRRGVVVVPAHPAISDDEEGEDDFEVDPDYLPVFDNLHTPTTSDAPPPAKRKRKQPAVEVLEEEEEEEEDDGDDDDEKPPKPTWSKTDLKNAVLPEYQHPAPDFIGNAYAYFSRYFTPALIRHIAHHTNLYASQKDPNTTFITDEDEMTIFVGILIYMGVVELPSVTDYWAMDTRVPQVANLMPSKRFRLLSRVVHFNDNTLIPGTTDRFFKVRPLFTFLNAAFRSEPETPKQSVDEVMVAYKGRTAGNLRQFIKNKPDKCSFKLFARASEDGFIHDMVLYQGKTTLEAQGVALTPEQKAMGTTSQIISVLASNMSPSTTTAVFADSFFTSLESSSEPKNEPVSRPLVIKSCNINMDGIDRSNLLMHLYRTPMRSKRWYMRLFAYTIDLSITNAWLIYRRDCKELGVDSQSLKSFRVDVFKYGCNLRPATSCSEKSSDSLRNTIDIPKPIRGHRSHIPSDSVRFDHSVFHVPVCTTRQTCKYCSKKENIVRSNVLCGVCKVHLCLNTSRNCFAKYHDPQAKQS